MICIFQQVVEELRRMFDKYMVKVLEFKAKNCVELVPIAELNGVISFTKLFDALATPKNGVCIILKIIFVLKNDMCTMTGWARIGLGFISKAMGVRVQDKS